MDHSQSLNPVAAAWHLEPHWPLAVPFPFHFLESLGLSRPSVEWRCPKTEVVTWTSEHPWLRHCFKTAISWRANDFHHRCHCRPIWTQAFGFSEKDVYPFPSDLRDLPFQKDFPGVWKVWGSPKWPPLLPGTGIWPWSFFFVSAPLVLVGLLSSAFSIQSCKNSPKVSARDWPCFRFRLVVALPPAPPSNRFVLQIHSMYCWWVCWWSASLIPADFRQLLRIKTLSLRAPFFLSSLSFWRECGILWGTKHLSEKCSNSVYGHRWLVSDEPFWLQSQISVRVSQQHHFEVFQLFLIVCFVPVRPSNYLKQVNQPRLIRGSLSSHGIQWG